jgi:hypothetical protein
MTDTRAERRRTVELWVWPDRDLLDDQRDLVIDRLRSLLARGDVDQVAVREWPHQLDVTAEPRTLDGAAREARECLADVRAWADASGVTLPLPDPVPAGTGRMGPTHQFQDLPRLMLVERLDGRVRFAAPCETDDGRCGVEEHVERIEAGRGVPV